MQGTEHQLIFLFKRLTLAAVLETDSWRETNSEAAGTDVSVAQGKLTATAAIALPVDNILHIASRPSGEDQV